MVGIAEGIPDAEYSLGDVIVANRLHDFSVTAAIDDDLAELDTRGGPMHPDVLKITAHLPALKGQLSGWNHARNLKIAKPAEELPEDTDSQKLYGS